MGIPALIEKLHQTDRRLEELTSGQVDAVVDRRGRTSLLRRAQDHLRYREGAILNVLPASIALLDPMGLITTVNESWRRFGRANALPGPGYGVGVNYLEICDSARGDDAFQAHQAAAGIRSVLDGGEKSFTLEYPCHSPAEQRWFLMTVTPLNDVHRNGAVVMHVNITERKRAEESLRESQQKMLAIFEGALDGILVSDVETGKFLTGNQAICDMLGYTQEEIVSIGLPDIHRKQDLQHQMEQVKKILRGDIQISADSPVLRKDGSVFYADIKAAPIRIGGRDCLLGIFRDITGRREAVEEIKFKNTILLTQQETSPDAILVVDENGHIVSYNQKFVDLWRLPPRLVSAQVDAPVLQSVVEQVENPEAFAELVQYLYEHREARSHEEVRLKDGRVIDRYSAPTKGADGSYYGRVWYFRDITERKQAVEAVQQSKERLRDLIDGLGPSIFVGLMTPQGILIEINRPALAATGLKPEDVLGKPFEKTYWWTYSKEVQQQLREAIAQASRGESCRYDVQVRTAENQLSDADFSLQPVRDETGRVVYLGPSASIITERKQAEKALRESKRRFSDLLENVELVSMMLDREAR
ncbi:MAG TPA: PAS domain S-box protein, partial [Gallionella sp.]|nr:PAS domain S-box protein [Gallionella sp.]